MAKGGSTMNPVQCVFKAFGGVSATAKAVGLKRSAVSRWQERGSIPTKALKPILSKALELGLDLTSDDLIHGRKLRGAAHG